jgi:predicted dehydrogenase
MPSSRPFRCAVLSAVKHDYIARGVTSHPRFQPVVVADDPQVPAWAHERNDQLAREWGIPYVLDVERALADFNVDVAIVSSQVDRHCQLSVRAALAGKHVIQDKPLSTLRSECLRLVAAVEQTGVKFLLWNRNFIPAILQAREQVAAGAIGDLDTFHADFYFAKDAGPPLGTRPSGRSPLDWQAHQIAAHADGSDGGLASTPIGEMANEGIYALGYLRMVTAAPVRRVFARCAAFFHQLHADNGVEDLGSMTLELEGGQLATIALGRIGAASHPSGGQMKLRLVGSRGALVIDELRPSVEVYYRDQPAREARQQRLNNENDFWQAEEFARAIDFDGPTILDARAGWEIFATIEAALESCRSGQPVNVRF